MYKDIYERNINEGRFGTAKQYYGMNRIKGRLIELLESIIHMSVILFNSPKRPTVFFDFNL